MSPQPPDSEGIASPLVSLLKRTTNAFEAAGFRYALIGAMARNAWARPRATIDVDLTIAVPTDRVSQLRSLLDDLGLDVRRELADRGGGLVPELLLLVDRKNADLRLDLLIACTPFEEDVLTRRIQVSLLGMHLWVASVEDVLVYKLVAGRSRDYADAEEVARTRITLGVEPDWSYVARWLGEFGVSERLTELREQFASRSSESE